ncbi:threonine--tRNA ligase [Actinoplanes derwentensis]|uniref:Threonine--tRNA ligase n=1 Tax=Actinoplanes derwentensis TaxID=113562 RepID=A0A1H2D410_9ACTN|nr:threonine--tRNA ligase [Actinoplanes derwentensis]GID86020.1 threonine--tRNA ligase [Actinoplanes derwentensis]SDT77475.1 threonyl-tRNA synthetase [Actinoplanes derwentensis]
MSADHRRLGRELDLFDSDPLIGAGLPFWLPAGAAARHEVESYLYELERRAGYQHVYSPAMGKRRMYELSGHWRNFADDMFPPMRIGEDELVLRPSLCPHHALIFRSRGRSYRELPLRLAELGPMYRAERSGVLGGLSRVRSMQLNDAHILCAEDQASAEVAGVLDLMRQAHAALAMGPVSYQLSLRGPGKKYGGGDESWARAEALLREALGGEDYVEVPGEAAFYGPKIDVQVQDPSGREWTLATVQIDYHQPEQFELEYAEAGGGKARPVMVHRSLVGSMERLFGHLIEVHQGAFPVWYAPVQLAILPVGPDQDQAAREFASQAADLRVEIHYEGSLSARIRKNSKCPYIAVVGARDVSLRRRDGDQQVMSPAEVIESIRGLLWR